MTMAKPSGVHTREIRSETKDQRIERAANRPGGNLWPQLRVGRTALYEMEPDWDIFQSKLERMNSRNGHAYTVGRFACHYLTDTEMRTMILDKYDKAVDSRKGAVEIYRGVKRSVQQFIDGEAAMSTAYYKEVVLSGDTLHGTQKNSPRRPSQSQTWVRAQLELRPALSGAIEIYDGNKWGLDLSLNDALYEERQLILTHLRQEEGLATRHARQDWQPHASIFEVYPHLRPQDVTMKIPEDMRPGVIDFDAPRAMLDL